MQGLAAVAASRGAARLLGAGEALLEVAGGHLYALMDQELRQRAADAARERLGERTWSAALDEWHAMSFEEAVAYARDGDEDLPAAWTEISASE